MDKTKNKLIVIAEDSIIQAEQLKYILEEEGFRVLHGLNGIEAFDIIKRERPILIISDIMMPEMDGYELCKRVKADEELKEIPVILLTALSDPTDVINGLECGADNFITKPYNADYLISRVQNIITNFELRKAQYAEIGIDVYFNGKNYRITSRRLQILDLLLSTYENSIQKNIELERVNKELMATHKELEYLNKNLEKEVETRTQKIIRLNSLLKAIRDINQLIVKEKDPIKMLNKACISLVKVRNYKHTWIMTLDEKGKVAYTIQEGIGNEFQTLEKDLKKGRWPVCCQKAMKQSEIVKIMDQKKECKGCPLVKNRSGMGCLTIQLEYSGRIYGILVINLASESLTNEEEHNLLYEVAGDLAFALHDIELEEMRKWAEEKLRRINRALKMISKCNQALIHAENEEKLLNDICRIIVDSGGYRLTWIGYAEKDEQKTVRPVAQAGYEDGYLKKLNITWADTERGRGPTGTAIRTGKPSIARNIFTDPNFAPWHADATKREYASSLALPVISGGQTFGALNIYAAEPDVFNKEEIKLLTELADEMAYGITALRTRKEHKQAEEALKSSEERLKVLFEYAPDAYYLSDIKGTFIDGNKAAEDLIGYKKEELIGKNYIKLKLLSAKELIKASKLLVKNVQGKGTGPDEFILNRKDGSQVQAEIHTYPVKIKDKIVILGIARDITERKQAEEQIRQLSQAVEQSPTSVMITDIQGNMEYANPKFTEITGYSVDEVKGQNPRILKSGEKSPEEYKELWDTITKGKTWHGEFHNKKKNGELYWEDATIGPIKNEKGEITHFITLKEDITERKKIEDELKKERTSLARRVEERTADLSKANAELAKAAKMKDEFLASMSHELRTPLNAVLGLSEALQEEVYGEMNQKQHKSLRSIEESGRHLLSLINDILDIAKIEAGKVSLEINQVPIEVVCQASLRLVKQTALKKNLQLTSNIRTSLLTFGADERSLKQILVNLLSNAVKFTHEGGEVGIEVTDDADKERINFMVWDTGIGIAKESMDKLFQPFIQIDSSLTREYSGTGLGLSLVKHLTELHGGSITVESEPGEGSRFTITLPVGTKTVVPALEVEEGEDETGQVETGEDQEIKEKSLILLAEDNEKNIEMLSDYLLAKGYNLMIARNGKEAIKVAKERTPDLILMDIQMPGMDGLEATRIIRHDQDEKLSKIPIIALTALVMPGDKEKCMTAGADDYLKKPVGLKYLVKKIEGIIK